MTTTVRRRIAKRCPYRGEQDDGTLTIEMPGRAPELHELAARIDALTAQPVSHEDFTAAVAALVPGARVITTWHTGPWAVQVTA